MTKPTPSLAFASVTVRSVVVSFIAASSGCLSVTRGDDARVHNIADDLRATVKPAKKSGDAGLDIPERAKVDEARALLERSFGANKGRFRHDATLDPIARVSATAGDEVNQRLSAELEMSLLWRAGVVNAVESSKSSWASGGARLSALDDFIVGYATDPPKRGNARYGLGRVVGGKRLSAAIIWINDDVALDPMDLGVPAGGKTVVHGHFGFDAQNVELVVLEDGVAKTTRPKLDADHAFTVEVAWSATPGVRMLELAARQHDGDENSSETYAWWPVYVGVDVPAVEPGGPVGATPPDLKAVEALTLKLRGKNDLVRDASLDPLSIGMPAVPASTCATWHRLHSKRKAMEELNWGVENSPLWHAWISDPKVTSFGVSATSPDADGFVEIGVLVCAKPAPAPPAPAPG